MNTVDCSQYLSGSYSNNIVFPTTLKIGTGSGDVNLVDTANNLKLYFNSTNLQWQFVDPGSSTDSTVIPKFGAGTNPGAIGTNTFGSSTYPARGDHAHAHGAQAGGALHAAATSSAHGFMSYATATYLPRIGHYAYGAVPYGPIYSGDEVYNRLIINDGSPVSFFEFWITGTSWYPLPIVNSTVMGVSNQYYYSSAPNVSDWGNSGITYNLGTCTYSQSASGSGIVFTGKNDGATSTLRGIGYSTGSYYGSAYGHVMCALEPIPNPLTASTGFSYYALMLFECTSYTKAVTVGTLIDHNTGMNRLRFASWTNATTPTFTDAAFPPGGCGLFLCFFSDSTTLYAQYSLDMTCWYNLTSINGSTFFGANWSNGVMAYGVGGYGYNVVNRLLLKCAWWVNGA
jgi:hypothetical protein